MRFEVEGILEVGISQKTRKPYGILKWIGGKAFVGLPSNVAAETLPREGKFSGTIETDGKEIRFRLEL